MQVAAILSTLVGADDADEHCLRLGGLDALRVEALAAGDPRSLNQVHAGTAGRDADAAVIASYRERGLRIRGAALHRLACEARHASESSTVLDVVEMLGPTWVVDDRGRWRLLPAPEPVARSITLTRTDDGWRIAAAR